MEKGSIPKGAKKKGGELPDRVEQALLFRDHKDKFKEQAYWSGVSHADDDACAWSQSFNWGNQGSWKPLSFTLPASSGTTTTKFRFYYDTIDGCCGPSPSSTRRGSPTSTSSRKTCWCSPRTRATASSCATSASRTRA